MAAGDWLGDIRLWDVADGKLVARMPLNPPTLAMLVESETQKFAAAGKALEQATGELTLAQNDFDAKTKALGAANDALAAATAASQKAAADLAGAPERSLKQKEVDEKAAGERLTTAKTSAAAGGDQAALDEAVTKAQEELNKIVAEKQTLAKTVADLTAANEAAAKQVAAGRARANLERRPTAAKTAVGATLWPPRPPAHFKAATAALAAAQAARDRATAEKAAYDAAHPVFAKRRRLNNSPAPPCSTPADLPQPRPNAVVRSRASSLF